MIRVTVEFYGAFREFADTMQVEIERGATVKAVLLKISKSMPELYRKIESTETRIIVLRGKNADLDAEVTDGDVLKIFSSALGG
jgi:molybdopterin converting factor small subunit